MSKKINIKEIAMKAAGTLAYTGIKNFALKMFIKDTTTRNLVSTSADAIVGFTNILPTKLEKYVSKEALQIKTLSNIAKTVMETNKVTAAYVAYIQEETSLINEENYDDAGMYQDTGENVQGEDALEMGNEFNEVEYVNGDLNVQSEETSIINQ